MANKLSFSQVNMYSTCGRKYELHYRHRLREKFFHSALAFGSAMDTGLNELLELRDLDKALAAFDKSWHHQYINGKLTALPDSELLVYAEKDFDEDLLTDDDENCLNAFTHGNWRDLYAGLKELKKEKGFDNLDPIQRQTFNYANWLCLRRKGHVMIESFAKKVLPKIKRVLTVQHKFQLENAEGDTIVAVADFICEWEDGKILLLDNKTSAKMYDEDQAARSAQLIVYYHKLKEEFAIDRVGFIVMNKQIVKNKIKICSKCGFDGSGGRAKTCDQEFQTEELKKGKPVMARCHGEWIEKSNPECFIQIIINDVTEAAEDLVLTAFDEANNGIKQEVFYKNLSACKAGFTCAYYRHCWFGDSSDLIKLESKE